MELGLVNEVLQILKGDRTLYFYYRDRYAVMLLQEYVGENGKTIEEVRKSPFGKLLNKPFVKEVIAYAGGGLLTADLFEHAWANTIMPFVLTLDKWGESDGGRWQQTSRKGYNLVLQMNFANDHGQRYQRLVKPNDNGVFANFGHPVVDDGSRDTLAWARIDVDFDTNEALIEEIQSDWVREVKEAYIEGYYEWDCDTTKDRFKVYLEEVLDPYKRVWDEAMLAAAISFIRKELGIERIYYHDYATGIALKGLTYSYPPRSLYTTLPKKFAFKSTRDCPEFLARTKTTKRYLKKVEEPKWFVLPM